MNNEHGWLTNHDLIQCKEFLKKKVMLIIRSSVTCTMKRTLERNKHLVEEWLIADGIEEKVQNGKDLFKYMIQRGNLGPCKLDHLVDMLQEIHRRDLAEKVKKFQSEGMFNWLKFVFHVVLHRFVLWLKVLKPVFYLFSFSVCFEITIHPLQELITGFQDTGNNSQN